MCSRSLCLSGLQIDYQLIIVNCTTQSSFTLPDGPDLRCRNIADAPVCLVNSYPKRSFRPLVMFCSYIRDCCDLAISQIFPESILVSEIVSASLVLTCPSSPMAFTVCTGTCKATLLITIQGEVAQYPQQQNRRRTYSSKAVVTKSNGNSVQHIMRASTELETRRAKHVVT